MTIRVGLIGLGTMGVPMAKNIAGAGLPLTVYNRSPGPLRKFVGTDVAISESVQDVFDRADLVVVIVNAEDAIDAVLGRRRERFAVSFSGKTIINAATVTPVYSATLGRDIERAGGSYIEAPVSGSRGPAEAGELLVMTAGAETDVDAAAPIFEAFGKESVYCGAPPNAMAMKNASNVLLAGVMGGLAEAISFARGVGLELELFAKVILGGPMANAFLEMKLPRAMAEDYSPQAAIKNVADALDVMIKTARDSDIEIPQAVAMRESCEKALEAGLGEEDILALVKVLTPERCGAAK